MPLSMACPHCGASYRLAEQLAGKLVRCAKCGGVFPVETNEKERLLALLAERRIVGGELWDAPHPSLPGEGLPGARRLRTRWVGLPVHQGLASADIARIADVLASARRKLGSPLRASS